MVVTSIGRIVAPSLAIVAASGAALFFGITHLRGEPPVEIKATITAAAALPPASGDKDRGAAGPAAAPAEVNAAAAVLGVLPSSPGTDQPVPAFDVARIDQTGEAVIAGRAAPGAVVELLRNGERHDRVVADQSGQFVMVPPRLPAGSYELTLRSSRPDGTQATSEQRVAVALEKAQSGSGTVGSHAAVRFEVPQAVANGQPARMAVATNAAALPNGEVAPAGSGVATTIVSRGDSLWRISRLTYGAGMRYALVYKANRNQIRNPDLIYPGQVFLLPGKAR